MSSEDTQRLQALLKNALKEKRSKKEITATFKAAGIIDEEGNLKSPYREIYIPSI